MHNVEHRRTARGHARVERSKNPLANVLAWIFRFPSAAEEIDVEVYFVRDGDSEIWTRRFAGSTFTTRLSPAPETSSLPPSAVIESFGPLSFELALEVAGGRLTLTPRRWWLAGCPLPAALIPGGNSYEYDDNGRFGFHIEIVVPLAGLVVRYFGTLMVLDE